MIAFLITVFTGYFLTKTFLPEIQCKGLIISFSVALGIAIESLMIYSLLFFNIDKSYFFLSSVISLFFISFLLNKFLKKGKTDTQNFNSEENKILNYLFYLMILFSILLFLLYTYKLPQGSVDGSFLWNIHTKFFYYLILDNESWKLFFNDSLYIGIHPDYPLLLPLYNLKNQMFNFGYYSDIIPIITCAMFYFSLIFGLTGLVKELSNYKNAIASGLILMSSKYFIHYGTSQCADIPLSLYILFAVGSLFLYEKYNNNAFLFFAFFFAGCCAFCKNEGIVFFIVFILLFFFFMPKMNKKIILLGIMFPLLCLITFKLFIYSKSDLFENCNLSIILSKIMDLSRIKLIFINSFTNLLNNWSIILFLIFAVFTGIKKVNKLIIISFLIMIVMYFAYYLIYLITPHNLLWHLNSSSLRLMVQYTPLFIFLICITFNCAENK